MKNLKLHLAKSKLYYFLSLILITLSSCGSYQNTTTDNDGIYNSTTKTQKVKEEVAVTDQSKSKAAKYQRYFKKKAEKYDIPEDEVFTDIDTYKSEADADEEELDREVDDFSYANNAWEESGETIVNVYDFGGFYRPWGWGFGWNNGFNNPWGWGFGWNNGFHNPWGWGFGWHGGFYNSWALGCGTFYGNGGFNRPFNNGFYGGHNDYAYGRRSARHANFASKYDRNRSRANTSTRRSSSRDANTTRRTRNNTNARTSRSSSSRAVRSSNQRTNRRVSTPRRNTSTRVRTNRSSSSRSVAPTRRSSSSRSSSVRSSSSRSSSARSTSSRRSSSSSKSSRRH